ncbi:MAG: FAD-dependent oxidoreductase [Coriobacteriales bacterium]|nr:FAD-dependent oxidoreductase [Coriobacteriales bacterium]
MSENISRRSFVASAAAVAGAAAVASTVKPAEAKVISETSSVWDLDPIGEPTEFLEADIAIIGAGGTGMACACQAKQLGLEPIVLEKREVTGGSFIGTEGLFALGTKYNEAAGTGDITVFDKVEQSMKYHHYIPNRALYNRFFNQTAETVQWLEDLGVGFQGAIAIGNGDKVWHVYERDLNMGPGATFQDSMRAAAANLGVQIELETPVKKIIVEDGVVKGVIAERADGTFVQVNAPAVAVCTGGYPQNKDFLYAVSETRNELILPQGVPGMTADGIKMARDAGAYMAEGLGTVMWCGPCINGAIWTHMDYCASVQPTLWINGNAERWIDESVWITDFAGVGLAQRNQDKTFIIFSENDLVTWEQEGPYGMVFSFVSPGTPMEGVREDIDYLVEEGNLVKCDTVEEMAAAWGLDAAKLQETLDTYNGYCAAGFDEDFHKPAEFLRTMEPPFYIGQTGDGYYTTCGGIMINVNCEVENEAHQVIPGLYAGGSDAGCLYGDSYDVMICPGSQASWANNSGRIIAMEAAKYIGK